MQYAEAMRLPADKPRWMAYIEAADNYDEDILPSYYNKHGKPIYQSFGLPRRNIVMPKYCPECGTLNDAQITIAYRCTGKWDCLYYYEIIDDCVRCHTHTSTRNFNMEKYIKKFYGMRAEWDYRGYCDGKKPSPKNDLQGCYS